MDVATTPEQYGEAFQAFVTKKADDSEDMEERAALKSLVDMIQGTLKAVEEAEKQQAEAQERINAALEAEAMGVAPADAVVDTASVLGAAQVASGVDEYARMAAGGADDGPSEAGLRGDALKTYAAERTSCLLCPGFAMCFKSTPTAVHRRKNHRRQSWSRRARSLRAAAAPRSGEAGTWIVDESRRRRGMPRGESEGPDAFSRRRGSGDAQVRRAPRGFAQGGRGWRPRVGGRGLFRAL